MVIRSEPQHDQISVYMGLSVLSNTDLQYLGYCSADNRNGNSIVSLTRYPTGLVAMGSSRQGDMTPSDEGTMPLVSQDDTKPISIHIGTLISEGNSTNRNTVL